MIKLIHISTAIISISFFLLRGLWVLNDSKMMQRKWVKILPHVNDTILLISAITLAIGIQQYPFVHGWLTAKLVALMVYIVFGMYALKRAKTKNHKIIFFILALITFGYIVMVAESRNSTWFF